MSFPFFSGCQSGSSVSLIWVDLCLGLLQLLQLLDNWLQMFRGKIITFLCQDPLLEHCRLSKDVQLYFICPHPQNCGRSLPVLQPHWEVFGSPGSSLCSPFPPFAFCTLRDLFQPCTSSLGLLRAAILCATMAWYVPELFPSDLLSWSPTLVD